MLIVVKISGVMKSNPRKISSMIVPSNRFVEHSYANLENQSSNIPKQPIPSFPNHHQQRPSLSHIQTKHPTQKRSTAKPNNHPLISASPSSFPPFSSSRPAFSFFSLSTLFNTQSKNACIGFPIAIALAPSSGLN